MMPSAPFLLRSTPVAAQASSARSPRSTPSRRSGFRRRSKPPRASAVRPHGTRRKWDRAEVGSGASRIGRQWDRAWLGSGASGMMLTLRLGRALLTLRLAGKNGAFAHADSELLLPRMHAAYFLPGARRPQCADRVCAAMLRVCAAARDGATAPTRRCGRSVARLRRRRLRRAAAAHVPRRDGAWLPCAPNERPQRRLLARRRHVSLRAGVGRVRAHGHADDAAAHDAVRHARWLAACAADDLRCRSP